MRYVPALVLAVIISLVMLVGALYAEPDTGEAPEPAAVEAPLPTSMQPLRPLPPHMVWNEEAPEYARQERESRP